MITFWIIAAGMIGVALAFLVPPLLGRGSSRQPPSSEQLNISIHRERLEQLQADLESGALTQERFESSRDELGRSLLEDLAGDRAESGARPARSHWTALVIGMALPLVSVPLYLWLGSSESLSPPVVADTQQQLSVEGMVSGLAERLRSQPNDAEGWLMLARSYQVLERYQESVAAYGRAHELIGDQPQLLVDYAEAAALATGQNQLAGRPTELLDKALALEPDNHKGLWLSGFAALQAGQQTKAISLWERLVGLMESQPEQAQMVREMIARTSAEPGSQADRESAPDAAIQVRVSIDPELGALIDGGETLFIFARAIEGPPMPLAIQRRQARDLPLEVTLDDSMSMMPAFKISGFSTVTVGARISRSGNATPQSGDLQGFATPVEVNREARVELTINERVP